MKSQQFFIGNQLGFLVRRFVGPQKKAKNISVKRIKVLVMNGQINVYLTMMAKLYRLFMNLKTKGSNTNEKK